MSKRWCLVLSVILLLSISGAGYAQDDTAEAVAEFTDHPARVVRNINGLNVRRTPAIEDDNIVGRLQPGQQVHVLAREGDWQQVRSEAGLFGWSHSDYLIDLPPRQLGETRRFRLFDPYADAAVVVDARLQHIGAHNYIYFNERESEGRYFSNQIFQQIGDSFDDRIYPDTLALWGEGNVPSIEGDERIVILIVDGYYDHINRLLNGWYTARHDMPGELNPYGNRIGFLGVRWMKSYYISLYNSALAHEFNHMLQHLVDANEESWIMEGLAAFTEAYVLDDAESVLRISMFFGTFQQVDPESTAINNVPLQPLFGSPGVPGFGAAYYGGWQLFMTYIYEQLGMETLQHFARHPQKGLASLNAVFAERGIDMDTDTLIAEWVLANYLQDTRLGDGRYGYQLLERYPAGTPSTISYIKQLPAQIQSVILQYATHYHELNLPRAEHERQITLDFRMAAPAWQDAWLQLVQVVDGQLHLQRFRARDFRNQVIPATLEAGMNYTFLAITPFVNSQNASANLIDYTLHIDEPDAPDAPDVADEAVAKAEMPVIVATSLHENELIQAAILGDALTVAQHLLSSNEESQEEERPIREEALRMAVAAGHDDVVALLILTDLDIHAQGENGYSAQELAMATGNAEVLELLRIASLPEGLRKDLDRPAPKEAQDIIAAFMRAARVGDLVAIEELLDQIPHINIRGTQRYNALHLAARHGQRNAVVRLLHAGAWVRLGAGGQNWPPLYFAIENGFTDIAALLIVAGTPLSMIDQSDLTPLHHATLQKNEFLVRLLLTDPERASIDAVIPYGATALNLAVQMDSLKLVNLLLAKGADPNILTDQSIGALGYAITVGNMEVIKQLLAYGADPNGDGEGSLTPLQFAVVEGSVEMVDLLLNAGADPTLRSQTGYTPAQIARERGFHFIASKLEAAAR